jgi:hypothetical protein
VDHLVGLRITSKECHNNKTKLLCYFIDFRKILTQCPRTNLWNRLKELKVPSKLRVVVVRLYEIVISSLGIVRVG